MELNPTHLPSRFIVEQLTARFTPASGDTATLLASAKCGEGVEALLSSRCDMVQGPRLNAWEEQERHNNCHVDLSLARPRLATLPRGPLIGSDTVPYSMIL
eukprot:3249865-Rhodomonas_salina.3